VRCPWRLIEVRHVFDWARGCHACSTGSQPCLVGLFFPPTGIHFNYKLNNLSMLCQKHLLPWHLHPRALDMLPMRCSSSSTRWDQSYGNHAGLTFLAHCSTQRAFVAAFGQVDGYMPFATLAGDADMGEVQGAAAPCVTPTSRPSLTGR
jgi:hypothetical protein